MISFDSTVPVRNGKKIRTFAVQLEVRRKL